MKHYLEDTGILKMKLFYYTVDQRSFYRLFPKRVKEPLKYIKSHSFEFHIQQEALTVLIFSLRRLIYFWEGLFFNTEIHVLILSMIL